MRKETKADIEILRPATKATLEGIKADIEAFKVELKKWILAVNLGTGILIVALVVAFLKLL